MVSLLTYFTYLLMAYFKLWKARLLLAVNTSDIGETQCSQNHVLPPLGLPLLFTSRWASSDWRRRCFVLARRKRRLLLLLLLVAMLMMQSMVDGGVDWRRFSRSRTTLFWSVSRLHNRRQLSVARLILLLQTMLIIKTISLNDKELYHTR